MSKTLEPQGLFHLATAEEWDQYQSVGAIEPPSLSTEGFVHCSWGQQVAVTVAKHFGGVTEVLALQLDPSLLNAEMVEEDTSGAGMLFPHVYGPIPVVAVTQVTKIGAPDKP